MNAPGEDLSQSQTSLCDRLQLGVFDRPIEPLNLLLRTVINPFVRLRVIQLQYKTTVVFIGGGTRQLQLQPCCGNRDVCKTPELTH